MLCIAMNLKQNGKNFEIFVFIGTKGLSMNEIFKNFCAVSWIACSFSFKLKLMNSICRKMNFSAAKFYVENINAFSKFKQ